MALSRASHTQPTKHGRKRDKRVANANARHRLAFPSQTKQSQRRARRSHRSTRYATMADMVLGWNAELPSHTCRHRTNSTACDHSGSATRGWYPEAHNNTTIMDSKKGSYLWLSMRQGIRTDTFSNRAPNYKYHSSIVYTNSRHPDDHRFDHRFDHHLSLYMCLTSDVHLFRYGVSPTAVMTY